MRETRFYCDRCRTPIPRDEGEVVYTFDPPSVHGVEPLEVIDCMNREDNSIDLCTGCYIKLIELLGIKDRGPKPPRT